MSIRGGISRMQIQLRKPKQRGENKVELTGEKQIALSQPPFRQRGEQVPRIGEAIIRKYPQVLTGIRRYFR
jgi:hypothetical protein